MKQSENLRKLFIKEAERLMKLSEEKRIEYVNAVLESLARGLKIVFSEKSKLKRFKLMREFMKDIEKNKVQIIVALLYVVKDEFRESIIRILDLISG